MLSRTSRSGRREAALALAVVVTAPALGGAAGCAKSPADRLEAAWKAADDGDREAFALLFTEQSAPLVRGLSEVRERTNGRLSWVEDVFSLLPRGDVTAVEERGNVCLVTVSAGGGSYVVRLLSERGEWHVDARALAALWRASEGDS